MKPSRYVGYAFAVADAVSAGEMYGVAVRIVRDLGNVAVEIAAMPGANGHCGIEGLEDAAAPDADTARAVRDELAFSCIERCREEPSDANEDAGNPPA